MIDKAQPLMAFMDLESSREFVDGLYSSDTETCLRSIICIKNAVIGSNRQKEHVIKQGIVPRLLQLLQDETIKTSIRTEAVVTIGSLAKGTDEHIEVLLKVDTIKIMLKLIEENDPKLVDSCLRVLRTLSQQDAKKPKIVYTRGQMEKILSFAGPSESLLRQSCVTSILTAACRGRAEQDALCEIGASSVLATLISIEQMAVRIPTLTCLAAMCYENKQVALEIANTTYKDVKFPLILVALVGRDKPVEMQLEAAKCLTNLHRAGAIPAEEIVITYRTLPCLVRLCQPEQSEQNRASAADTLAYLTEMDTNLQQTAAISNQLIAAVSNLLTLTSTEARRSAFRVFASLGANDEDIRKKIIQTHRLMERVLEGLEDSEETVRLAACRCLHSLSRSVQQLRTTFQDHTVWKPLMGLITGITETDVLNAGSSALCNLLLEFSPAKEPILQLGVIQFLVSLSGRPEECLRLNAVWALMNLAFQADKRVKCQILTYLGTDHIFRLLADPDVKVLMKMLGLLRNLVSPRDHTDHIMSVHGNELMQAIVLVLEGAYTCDVKEQALCILANIADGETAKELIMDNDDVLTKVRDYLAHPVNGIQTAAIFCIGNLLRRGEPDVEMRLLKLREIGIATLLQQLVTSPDSMLYDTAVLDILEMLTD